MDIPRDSSDIQIALACTVCNGNGGIGHRKPTISQGKPVGACFNDCTSCNGTGWTLKRPADLTPKELARLQSKIPQRDTGIPACSSIIGTVIEAGTDDSGQPRITIHTTEEELKRIELIRFYQQARITFAVI